MLREIRHSSDGDLQADGVDLMPIIKSTRKRNFALWSDGKIAEEIIKLEARLQRLYQERNGRGVK